jgi:patatin-like phospholipase/acyl hydrolase
MLSGSPTLDSSSLDDRPFQVLALDGGGYRGLFAAQVLAEWERQLGRPIASCFDLIVGTSTGGIIALGLASGMPASALVDFYVEDGKRIFPSRWSARRFWSGARHWFVAKYNPSALEASLRHRFGEKTLAELTTPVVIPSFKLQEGKHWYFKTPHFSGNLVDHRRPVWEVARATSAAPTYFPAFCSSESEVFIDGGVLANNPSMVGYLVSGRKLSERCSSE